MCRTGKVYSQCECGTDITCIYELLCPDCAASVWEDDEPNETDPIRKDESA